jgi:hypothetical protein
MSSGLPDVGWRSRLRRGPATGLGVRPVAGKGCRRNEGDHPPCAVAPIGRSSLRTKRDTLEKPAPDKNRCLKDSAWEPPREDQNRAKRLSVAAAAAVWLRARAMALKFVSKACASQAPVRAPDFNTRSRDTSLQGACEVDPGHDRTCGTAEKPVQRQIRFLHGGTPQGAPQCTSPSLFKAPSEAPLRDAGP